MGGRAGGGGSDEDEALAVKLPLPLPVAPPVGFLSRWCCCCLSCGISIAINWKRRDTCVERGWGGGGGGISQNIGQSGLTFELAS